MKVSKACGCKDDISGDCFVPEDADQRSFVRRVGAVCRRIAAGLNEKRNPVPHWGKWSAAQVKRILDRTGG